MGPHSDTRRKYAPPLTSMAIMDIDGKPELVAPVQSVATYYGYHAETVRRRIHSRRWQAFWNGRQWYLPLAQFPDLHMDSLLHGRPV